MTCATMTERKSEVTLGQRIETGEGEGLAVELGGAVLLDGDRLGGDLIAVDLTSGCRGRTDGVYSSVVHVHEHESLVVHEGLRPMAIAHAGVPGSGNETVGELEDLELSSWARPTKEPEPR